MRPPGSSSGVVLSNSPKICWPLAAWIAELAANCCADAWCIPRPRWCVSLCCCCWRLCCSRHSNHSCLCHCTTGCRPPAHTRSARSPIHLLRVNAGCSRQCRHSRLEGGMGKLSALNVAQLPPCCPLGSSLKGQMLLLRWWVGVGGARVGAKASRTVLCRSGVCVRTCCCEDNSRSVLWVIGGCGVRMTPCDAKNRRNVCQRQPTRAANKSARQQQTTSTCLVHIFRPPCCVPPETPVSRSRRDQITARCVHSQQTHSAPPQHTAQPTTTH